MARPRNHKKSARLTVSLDKHVYDSLCDMAECEDVSVAWIVRRAVNDLIARQIPANDEPELPLIGKLAQSKGAR
jgi:predicted DNA-binding ribbon-helix-helix protein